MRLGLSSADFGLTEAYYGRGSKLCCSANVRFYAQSGHSADGGLMVRALRNAKFQDMSDPRSRRRHVTVLSPPGDMEETDYLERAA